MAVHFKLDYVNADGDISNYYPDFVVKLSPKKFLYRRNQGTGRLRRSLENGTTTAMVPRHKPGTI